MQKENSNNYQKYLYEEDNDKMYSSRDNIETKNNNRYWRPKKVALSPLPSSNSRKYLSQKNDNFLSKVGNNIITSKSLFEKKINIKYENNKNSVNN